MPIADVSGQSIRDLVTLRGRTAVVTGSARGIGKAIAQRFAEAGATLVISDIDGGLAEHAAAEIAEQYGVEVRAHQADVRDRAHVDALVELAAQEGDGI